jgi:thymidylate synthase ThyX
MPIKTILKFYDGDVGITVGELPDSDADKLDKFVTNTNDNIFAWKIGDSFTPEQAGALLSRYSRTSFTGRELLLKEFLPNSNRGREFFESWLVDYGDDSIQEMAGGIPTSCEFVSNLLAKVIEDGRFASYIEKSTRYVSFDKKLPDGSYMFYKDKEIMGSRFADEYLELMNGLFESYSKHMEKMVKHIGDMNPIEDQKFRIGDASMSLAELDSKSEERLGVSVKDLQRAYANSVKANALDLMRDYLPMATLTHVGISANARAYEALMLKLLASGLSEAKHVGNRLYEELYKIVPSLVKRVYDIHGKEFVSFLHDRDSSVSEAVAKIDLSSKGRDASSLIDYTGIGTLNPDQKASVDVAGAVLYRFGRGIALSDAIAAAGKMDEAQRNELISKYVGIRKNRRHRPGRAFENVEYLFDFIGRIGIYRDLQRHRVGTQERQNFTVDYGYDTRKEYESIGITEDYKSKMSEVIALYDKLRDKFPMQAQYVVTFGFKTRWYYRMNARELYHMVELRTTPSGHPDYRKLMQDSFKMAEAVHPSITKHMSFVDMSDKQLGRLGAEIRIAQKRNALKSA